MTILYRPMMHATFQHLIGAVALVAAIPVFAADSICPDTVSVTQTGTAPAPEWTVSYSATPVQVEMVTFFNGPPKEEASLVYDTWANAKDTSVATWRFPKDSRGYWIKCSYRRTSMELSKALPPTISSCRVTYDRQSSSSSGLPAVGRIDGQ